ncbi:hypothetical protein V8G54_036761 [Vigna mungo]|uniref:Uncharacterized protein n=1 Tax=Vigna mungo TaxID=3915 RepID=A0AAQ3MHN7_VIGMU
MSQDKRSNHRKFLASPRAASFKYLSASWTLFTFSCSWTSMLPYSNSLFKLIVGCSKVGGASFEFTSFFPIASTPTPEIHFLTSSSYTLALSAPKKSMDWPGKVSTSLTMSSSGTLSVRKIPLHTPTRSSLVGAQ